MVIMIRPRKPVILSSNNWVSDEASVRTNRELKIFALGNSEIKKNTKNNQKTKEKNGLLKQLSRYCENTTLHGLRYVGDTHLTFGERIFWFIAFSFAIACAGYYITNIYEKWKSSPVIISFSPFDADLNSIPFPAITICNMNQAKRNEAENIIENGSNVEKKLLNDACNGNATFNDHDNVTWTDLNDFLIKVGNSCKDVLKFCQWGSQIVDCEVFFNNDLTDEGLCCSFNRLPPENIFRNPNNNIRALNRTYDKAYDWNAEKGYEFLEENNESFIPRRPLGAGAHLGLSVIVDAQIDNYYCSSTRSIGFKVILSNPIETPKMADFGFFVSPGYETRITIQPVIREASNNLKNVDISKRQCYFSDERRLQYYRTYTQRNCMLECQSNFTFESCKCIPYYLPKSVDVPNCSGNVKKCVLKAKNNLELSPQGIGANCNCLPACVSVQYTQTRSYGILSDNAKLNLEDIQSSSTISAKHFVKNMAVMQIYFFNSKFTTELKSELYGFTEILSNIGGLLSLCLGFSFLSLVELIYFLTLRLACYAATLHRNRRKLILEHLFVR